ncbi:MAG TPA: aspartate aminotransferase family protein [Chitinophagales bacterium]|nr:aspartate aminotransferase family protein [Chitinophagales bacterium]
MLEIATAKGVYLYSQDGKKYLDLISGISVSYLGHAHPRVVDAVKKQAGQHLHLMVYGEYIQSPQVRYARLLAEHLPEKLSCVYFVNSGAEAAEGAMKLAKKAAGRTEIVYFDRAYHGSTQGALSLIGSRKLRQPFLPLLPDVREIRFNETTDLSSVTQKTACVFIEPVQGEAGVRTASRDFLKALRNRCDETGALLVFDEAQTAFGRTGKLFAFEQHAIVPDILLLAKGLGGGMPLGAFIASKELMAVLSSNPALGHITTFGGHPVCCAAGMAALTALLESGWMKKVKLKEALFRKLLVHPAIKQIRSAGLLLAVEFDSFAVCRKIIDRCIKNGVVTDWFLFAENCLRIAPPLIITEAQIKEACRVIMEAIDFVMQNRKI